VSACEPDVRTAAAKLTKGRRDAVLAVVCLALMLVVASLAMVYVVLPAIAVDVSASQSQLVWVAEGYGLFLAALLLPAGALGDRYGRRPALLGGIGLFALASAASALASSATSLIAARAAAGAGAALIMPGTLATITTVFPEEERARAVGVWAGFTGAGAVVGIVMAGALLEAFWWGSIFVAAAGLAIVAFVATAVVVPPTRSPDHAHLDPLGSLLSFAAIGGFMVAVIEGPDRGWTGPAPLAGLALALFATAAFAAWERRSSAPLLDPALFRSRGFATGTVSLVVLFLAIYGFFFLVLQYLQLVLGYGTLSSSLRLLPLVAVMLPLATVAAGISQRLGMRVVTASGLVVAAAGFLLLAMVDAHARYGPVLPGLVLVGAGVALAMTPATNAIVTALPLEKQGVASAVNDAARQIGAALGVAILGSAFNTGYRHAVSATARNLPAPARTAVRHSPAAALRLASHLGPDSHRVITATRQAFMTGMHWSLSAGTALLVLGAIYTATRAPGPAAGSLPDPAIALATTPPRPTSSG
jgi:EmrB/QacA subfamily drug resistance transporter